MRTLVDQWHQEGNLQAVFLDCYMMMTTNMLAALEHNEFRDPAWVDNFIDHFADYYFLALDAYDRDPSGAPLVWQLAHNSTRDPHTTPLQNLLLGVNAHINFDLVLTLVDLLKPEWYRLSDAQRAARYADYARVNDVIAHTVDSVQDGVLEPAMPSMVILDKLLGPFDELLISRLLTRWRETVWHSSSCLLETQAGEEQQALLRQVEDEAMRIGRLICLRDPSPPTPGSSAATT